MVALILPAVSGSDSDKGTYRGLPPASAPARRRWSRQATTWALAAAALLVIAGVGGLATAYVVANMRAVAPPDAALLPTPTPASSASPGPTASPPTTASPSPTVAATPTPAGPTPEPTPEPTPFEYEVQAGDSITRIALRFGVTPESIIELNGLRNPNRILPGQILLIPAIPNASPSPAP